MMVWVAIASIAMVGITATDSTDDSSEEAFDTPPGQEVRDLIDSMTSRLARERNQEGLEALRATPPDLPRALESFTAAMALDGDDVEIINNLGFIYSRLGNLENAERLLRQALRREPKRLVALTNLADTLVAQDSPQSLSEANDLLRRARELAGNRVDLVTRQATVARRRGREADALRYYGEAIDLSSDDPNLMLTLGDYYRELAQDELAAQWYRRIPETNPVRAEALERLEQLEIEREARRYGWSPTSRGSSPKAQNLVRRADALLARGELSEGEKLARQAVEIAPQDANAHRVLGDIELARRFPERALASFLRGLVVEPNHAGLVRRVGLSYQAQSRFAESSVLLTRALQLRPDWIELRVDLALALQRTGELPASLRELDRFLDSERIHPRRREAERLRADLSGLFSSDPTPTASPDSSVAECFNRARALLARGKTQEALAALNCSDDSESLRLRSRILAASGQSERARSALTRWLLERPNDAGAHYELGLLERSEERLDEARVHLAQAERLGFADATYQLARVDLQAFESRPSFSPSNWPLLVRAYNRLGRYQLEPEATFAEASRDARLSIQRTFLTVASSIATTIAAMVIASLAWRRRRNAGMALTPFIARHPEAGAEVQAVLAAIRHEVLKHHTTALQGLVDSLRAGDERMTDLQTFERVLFEAHGVAAKLEGYVEQLERIGQRFDTRLNLRRRDPVIAPLLQGFTLLRRVRRRMQRPTGRNRRFLIRALQRASEHINDEAYRAVHDVLDELRHLKIDEALLHGLAKRTTSEPGFSEISIRPLELIDDAPLPQPIVAARALVEDALINLLRNAYQSSSDVAEPIPVAIRASVDVDELTGLSYLTLTVFDQADAELTPDAFQDASAESGLGIVRECVGRSDGIARVVSAPPPWSKGVAVSFPIADTSDEHSELELAS
ncbi:MAG: tetratricopeptide repeat protein [Myxococcota bacterium]